jgi:hypothetical protein
MDLGTTLRGGGARSPVEKLADDHLMKDVFFHRHGENIVFQFRLGGFFSLKIVYINDGHTVASQKNSP